MGKLISDNIINLITCAILAGGKGSRMGNQDKGLVHFRQAPLIEQIIKKVSPQVKTIIINANRNINIYKKYGFDVIPDAHENYQGPLAGIAAALQAAKTPLVMTVPCDSPLLPNDLAARLYAALNESAADLAVVDSGRLQPVFCLLKKELLGSLLAFLNNGGRKIDLWYNEIKITRVNFSDKAECFTNINSPTDMKVMENAMKIIGFCAYSGTGKTTLLKQLIPRLKQKGLRIGVIKHAHHSFDTDQPGKDSYELRKSGAKQMLISSNKRWALITEHFAGESEPGLNDLLKELDLDKLDLVLVEGFKSENFPKIELHRSVLGKDFIYPADVIAFASDVKIFLSRHST